MPGSGTQQNGEIFLEGGFWKLRWYKETLDPNGSIQQQWAKPAWIGPATGPQRMTEAEARQIARENFLSRLDQHAPQSQPAMTVVDFVKSKFVPEHVAMKRSSGQTHYRAILKYVLPPEQVDALFQVDEEKSRGKLKAVPNWPYLSNARLKDVQPEDIQRLITAALAHGYSTQTATHIRNAVRAIFAHAAREQCFSGENPAGLVRSPEMVRKEPHALTLAQSKEVIAALRYPAKELALFAILSGMNVAEICGLQWKHVNLTEDWSNVDGEPIPPRSIAVRTQWSSRELVSVRNANRARNLRIPEPLFPVLLGLHHRAEFTRPDDFVLVSRAGTPLAAHHIAQNQLKRIGHSLQMPWLSWQALLRTHSTLAYELGMQEISKVSAEYGRAPVPRGRTSKMPLANRHWVQQVNAAMPHS